MNNTLATVLRCTCIIKLRCTCIIKLSIILEKWIIFHKVATVYKYVVPGLLWPLEMKASSETWTYKFTYELVILFLTYMGKTSGKLDSQLQTVL